MFFVVKALQGFYGSVIKKTMAKGKTFKKGFSLIELLIVLAVIGILIMVANSTFLSYAKIEISRKQPVLLCRT